MTFCYLNSENATEALELSDLAGWNQTKDDWRAMLSRGTGIGFRTSNENLIATALLFPVNERLSWISMVLVHTDYRRRGLATRLLHGLLHEAESQNVNVGLDATAAGRPLYLSLGFESRFEIIRWRRDPGYKISGFKPIRRSVEAEKTDFVVDKKLFDHLPQTWQQAYSLRLFDNLATRHPNLLSILKNGETGTIHGLCAGRSGRNATQIGPVLAHSDAAGFDLVDQCTDLTEAMIVDATATSPAKDDEFRSRGFSEERRFTRMTLGKVDLVLPEDGVFAIAGPELG